MTFRLLIGSLISFSFFSFATAKTPLEVLEPYRSYKAALKKQQFADAQEFAYEAWQKAEKLLKDSRTTGDLAYNYAILPPDSQNADIEDAKTQAEYTRKRVRKKVYNRIRDAFDRSIELAELHAEIPYEVEVQRRIRSFEFDLTGVKFSGNKLVTSADQSELYLLDKAIVDFGLIGTTYEAEALTLRSQYYRQRANNDKALEYSEKAIELFEKTDDGLPTAYPYLAKLAKGSLLDELGQKIPAALSYQEVMQNLEGTLDAEHPFIQKAFSQWMWARNEIERAGELEEAEQAGLCKCWPYEEYLNQPVPAIRIPPIMPKRAQRSGHVIVKYDVDETGVPYNISEVSSSSKVFTKSALRSVEAWRHLDVTEETHLDFDPESRKNLTTTIFFRLSDQNGKLIPE